MGVCLLFLIWVAIWTPSSQAQTTLTYENWAEGFFTQTCCSCHHSSLEGDARWGAPKEYNFETLDLVREHANDIKDVAIGDFRFMPPMGITWPWDRDNLEEWINAGMPGAEDSLNPAPVVNSEKTLHFQKARLNFSRPLTDPLSESEEPNFFYRSMRFRPYSEKDTEVPEEYRFYLRVQQDGSVLIEKERHRDGRGGTRILEYTPHIPILFSHETEVGEPWLTDIQVYERHWVDGEGGRTYLFNGEYTERWGVGKLPVETIDNGVILPVEALKMVQTNFATSTTRNFWFTKGLGLTRMEIIESATEYEGVRTVFNNIIRESDPLRDPPIIQEASNEWLPLYGPDYNPEASRTEIYRMDYSYEFDYQQYAVVDSSLTIDPTSTPLPLPEDPTPTPVLPEPTATPVGFGEPDEVPTLVPTTSPTPSKVEEPVHYSPEDPRISNLMADDDVVDEKDLLIFLQHWHKAIE